MGYAKQERLLFYFIYKQGKTFIWRNGKDFLHFTTNIVLPTQYISSL